MKKWIISNCIFIIITIVACYIIKDNSDGGFKNIKTVEDYQNIISQLEIFPVDYSNPDYGKSQLEQKEKTFQTLNGENMLSHYDVNVFVVEVEEDFALGLQQCKQKAKVVDVVKGNEQLLNQFIYIVSMTSINYNPEQEAYTSYWANNIMLPNNRYLVFCEKTEISDYLDTPHYRTLYTSFKYLNLGSSTQFYGLPDKYENIKDCEFLLGYKQSADALTKLKQEIIDYYIPEYVSENNFYLLIKN